jgi:hypothetical protein
MMLEENREQNKMDDKKIKLLTENLKKLPKEQINEVIREEFIKMYQEGFFDRAKAKGSGALAGLGALGQNAKTAVGNVGNFVKTGDPGQVKKGLNPVEIKKIATALSIMKSYEGPISRLMNKLQIDLQKVFPEIVGADATQPVAEASSKSPEDMFSKFSTWDTPKKEKFLAKLTPKEKDQFLRGVNQYNLVKAGKDPTVEPAGAPEAPRKAPTLPPVATKEPPKSVQPPKAPPAPAKPAPAKAAPQDDLKQMLQKSIDANKDKKPTEPVKAPEAPKASEPAKAPEAPKAEPAKAPAIQGPEAGAPTTIQQAKKRGRPPGTKNKPKDQAASAPSAQAPKSEPPPQPIAPPAEKAPDAPKPAPEAPKAPPAPAPSKPAEPVKAPPPAAPKQPAPAASKVPPVGPVDDAELDLGLEPDPAPPPPAPKPEKPMNLGLEPDPVLPKQPIVPIKGMNKGQPAPAPAPAAQSTDLSKAEDGIKQMYSQSTKTLQDFKKTISGLQNLLKQARGK